jgi:hypothetical protein
MKKQGLVMTFATQPIQHHIFNNTGIAIAAVHSPVPAMQLRQLRRGGHTAAIRCICVISAASAGASTMQKC